MLKNLARYFPLVLCVCGYSSSLAQTSNASLTWGPSYKMRSLGLAEIVSADTSSFYTLGSHGIPFLSQKYTFTKWNTQTLAVEWQLEQSAPEVKGKSLRLQKSFAVSGCFYTFYTWNDRVNGEYSIVVQKIDREGVLGDLVEVSRSKSRNIFVKEFDISWSRDSSRFVVLMEPTQRRMEPEYVHISVVDTTLEVEWQKEFSFDFTESRFDVVDFGVTNKGEVFVLGYTLPDYARGERFAYGKPNRDFILYQFVNKNEGVVEVNLGLKDVFLVGGAGIKLDNYQNHLAVYGFFSNRRYSQTDGGLFITLDQSSLDLNNSSFHYFDEKARAALLTKSAAKRGRAVRDDYIFRQFIRRPDGGSFFVGEDYDFVEVSKTIQSAVDVNTLNYQYDTYYYYDEIIGINVNPAGEIESIEVVNKFQLSKNDRGPFSGFVALPTPNGFAYVYNDNKKNFQWFGSEKRMAVTRNFRQANLVAVEITYRGDVVGEKAYTVIQNNAKARYTPLPKRGVIIEGSGGDAIIPAVHGQKLSFGRLTFGLDSARQ